MKVSRILSVFLAIVMLCGCFAAFPVSAEGTEAEDSTVTVYLSSAGNNGWTGLSETTAVRTLNQAIVQVNEKKAENSTITSGKIVLLDNITISYSQTELFQQSSTVPITVSGKVGTECLIFDLGANANRYYTIASDTTYSNMKIAAVRNSTSGNLQMNNNGCNLVIDADVLPKGSNDISLQSGYSVVNVNVAASYNDQKTDANTVLNDGEYSVVYGVGGSKCGTVNGNVRLEVNERATIKYFNWVALQTDTTVTGNYDVYVNNAVIDKDGFRDSDTSASKISKLTKIEGRTTLHILGSTVYKLTQTADGCSSIGSTAGSGTADSTKGIWYAGGFGVDTSEFTGDKESLQKAFDGWSTLLKDRWYGCTVEGIQSTTAVENGKVNVRCIIGILDWQMIDSASVTIKATVGGTEKTQVVTLTKVYTSILATVDGLPATVTASDMGTNYIMAVTIEGIPADETVDFEFTPKINDKDAPMKSFTYSAS